ncbi:MAG: hypothetical protein GY714_09360 [Desulfobacterales bacterium]|nr:hypothetical protein [Desulfobacterales bacterium]
MKKLKSVALLFLVLFLLLGCDEETNESELPSNQINENFHISDTYIKDNELYITASSTLNEGSISSFIRLRIKDENDKILTTGPNGWILEEQFTKGERVFSTIKISTPQTDIFLIEGIEMLNVNGITQQSAITNKYFIKNDMEIEKI